VRKGRGIFVVTVVAVSTFGVPGPVRAEAPAPKTLDASLGVRARIAPDRAAAGTIALPWRANLIGVSFDSADAESADIRVRAHGPAGWSLWKTMVYEEDEGPDGDDEPAMRAGAFTLPLWVGLADTVQLRVAAGDRAVRDVRLVAFNTNGDAYHRNPFQRAWDAIKRGFTPRTPVAEAMPNQPGIITRAEWGADESLRTKGPGIAPELWASFVHHTAGTNSYSKSESASIVRGIYAYHTKGRGYSDIAYNFLVDRYGQVFEGRAGGIDQAVIGAHAGGFNTYTTGVALMGTFQSVAPPKAARTALVKLLRWKLDVHHVPPIGRVTMIASSGTDKYAEGTRVRLKRINGHRDANATSCPGQKTYDLLPSIRKQVDGGGHPKIYRPRTTLDTLRPDGDGVDDAGKIKAEFSKRVRWTLRIRALGGAPWRTFRGTGERMAVRWNGTDAGGLPVPSGVARWTIEAKRPSTGKRARPASGSLMVLSPLPRSCGACVAATQGADFDGDGFADLAIGVPGEDFDGAADAGAVNVLYGSAGGLTGAGDDRWREGWGGLPDAREPGDGFGSALAAGDFDGDGFADLAVGVPREDVDGALDAGAVDVIRGSADGLTGAGSQRFAEGAGGVPGYAETGDGFGSTLASGDLNGDGFDDLVIGIPGEDLGATADAGKVQIVFGTAAGLTGVGARTLQQNQAGIPGRAEPRDLFGAALAVGDLNGGTFADLAIGSPGDTAAGVPRAGRVYTLFGGVGGPALDGIQVWHQGVEGIADDPETGDGFGASLAIGNLGAGARGDLVIGIPGEDVGDVADAGAVAVLFGSTAGITAASSQLWTQDSVEIPDTAERGDGFGSSVAARDLDADGFAELIVGAPHENLGARVDAGALTVLPGSAGGPLGIGSRRWTEGTTGVPGQVEYGDVFAAALGVGDFNGDGFGDVAIGAPGENLSGMSDVGEVKVLLGSAAGLASTGASRWSQRRSDVKGVASAGDLLGML